jgi:dihydroorotate dehydrogenase electron transfer subunit
MHKTAGDLLVVRNTQLNHDNYLIVLKPDIKLSNLVPGQFVNVLVKGSPNTFLRRPFSIHDVNYVENTLSILVKTVGDGTYKLSETRQGDTLDLIYPLGNGFSRPKAGQKILLVGGGVGIAPMMHMARESKAIGAEVSILLGARSKRDHILLNEFSGLGQLFLTTNDGSLATKGFVTDHEIFNGNEPLDHIYCCGPDPMMHAVARKAAALGVDCEVSLENMMACGYGVCLCCVTKTTQGHKCVCTDGPVFNINQLQWQI